MDFMYKGQDLRHGIASSGLQTLLSQIHYYKTLNSCPFVPSSTFVSTKPFRIHFLVGEVPRNMNCKNKRDIKKGLNGSFEEGVKKNVLLETPKLEGPKSSKSFELPSL